MGYELFNYAYLGHNNGEKKFKYLAYSLAEKEKWSSNKKNPNFDILRNYIYNTFEKAYNDGNVYEVDSVNNKAAVLNTGLLTNAGEEIFMYFTENKIPDKQPWHLFEFIKESDRLLFNFQSLPPVNEYLTNNIEDLYFDPNKEIMINFQHIFDEREDRLIELLGKSNYELFNSLGKKEFVGYVDSQIKVAQKKIKRNQRLVVPMWYKNKITYLIPVQVAGRILPIAIEKYDTRYRANTILTKVMAYKNARLLMKPESHWLAIE